MTVTINREMRNLIQSLQNHNQQLKMESSRYKRRLKEAQQEAAKVNHFVFKLTFFFYIYNIFVCFC
jgi:regulator of replication initiation timing